MSIRKSFVEHFGEENALAMEHAAQEHENGLHPNKGSDPFKRVLMLTISYECASKPNYASYHGITAEWEKVHQWIIDRADIASYDGDVDMLAALSGAYNQYVGEEA
jgi:hypothetical protein